MKTLTDNQKRNILAPFIADQIANEALNEDFVTITEILARFNRNWRIIYSFTNRGTQAGVL